MKVVALISGGKDSCYNMMQCVAEGHELIALANLKPKDKDEMDSYMYQTVGHHAVDLYAEAMGLPLYRRTIEGQALVQDMDYHTNLEDEVEDLYELLKMVKDKHGVQGVSVGAILSDYQRVRVEHVCVRLGLTSLAYLWRRDQTELLQEMVGAGVHAIIIKVAALGLHPDKHLGKSLAEIFPHMLKMKEKYGLNVCGEGGEYETFTLDCPLFNKKIVVDEVENVLHSKDDYAPVGYLNLHKMHLEDKDQDEPTSLHSRLADLNIKRGTSLLNDLGLQDAPESSATESDEDDITEACLSCAKLRIEGSTALVCRQPSGHLWVCGVMGRLEDGSTISDITHIAMQQLKGVLAADQMEFKHLVAMHLYVKEMSQYAEINAVYKTYFENNPAIRVCVETRLPENVILQIDCLGYHSTESPLFRRTLHVQGLSHWAPANIGPYSQAVKLGDTIYIAGQIGMQPTDLSLISGGVLPQSRLSLRHVQRVLAAMFPSCNCTHVGLGICYVTSRCYIPVAQREWESVLKQSQESCSDESVAPLMEYVVVPGLPKGASVEWQVSACVTEGCYKDTIHTKGSGTCKININSRWIEDIPESASLLAKVEKTSSTADFASEIEDVMAGLVKGIEESMLQMNFSLDTLRSLRIFYKQSHTHFETLFKAFTNASKDKAIAASFVPVITFADPNCIMSVCC